MKFLSKKAMTLFELLAVLVILGIVAAIAFPTISKLVDNQKRSAFAEEANLFIDRAVTYAQLEYEDLEADTFAYFFNYDKEDIPAYVTVKDGDISEDFENMSDDYKGYIVFKINKEDKLVIVELKFVNEDFIIKLENDEVGYKINTRFTRDDENISIKL